MGVNMTKSKRVFLTLLSLIGLGLSIELCVVYYNANLHSLFQILKFDDYNLPEVAQFLL